MATLAVTNDFSAGAAIVASEMNTNFSDVETFINSTPGVLQLTGGTVTGAVTLSNTLTVGADDTGYDVKLFGATTGKSWLWDESGDTMFVTGGSLLYGNLTVGVDDTGHDVKFFGATSGEYLLWDESADQLDATGDIRVRTGDTYPVVIGSGKSDTNNANIAIGTAALTVITGGNNIAIGYKAMDDATSADTSVAIGNYALEKTVTADYNTAVGHAALGAICGNSNVAVGRDAGLGITGANNVAVGMQTQDIGVGGGHNTTVGYQSGRNYTTGSVSVAIGAFAGNAQTEAAHSVFVGYNAGQAVTTAATCVAIGSEALKLNVAAGSQVAVGYQSLLNSVGVQNTAIGSYAGHWITSGVNNTMIGYYAGNTFPTTGGNNTCLGYYSKPSLTGASNEVTLGDSNITALRCQVDITVLSDGRDKAEIEDLDVGLDFIRRLKPRRWSWDMREETGKHGIADSGFVAQELQQAQIDEGAVIPNLVYESNPDRLESSKATLIPVLVKAVQELAEKVEAMA